MGIRLTTSFKNVLGKLYQVNIHDDQFVGSFEVKYGLLYNFYAFSDVRNIAPTGWQIPVRSDYETLIDYVETGALYYSNTNVGKILKESSAKWSPNTGTNTALFNFVGGGHRNETTGAFSQLQTAGYIWANTGTFCLVCLAANDNCTGGNYVNKSGRSIRLIKTTTTLSDGETGTMTGNDGKVYRTICIGTQEWLADNLCETKYRNGDTITEVTDATDWAALTVGALCAYDNDWANAFIYTSGLATEYISGKSGFNLSYQTAGDDYLTTPIIASSVELPIHIRDNNRTEIESFIQDLISSDEDRFMVLIYENGSMYWRGKIQVERVQIPDRFYTEISIFAADGLGRLDSIQYDNAGTLYTGWETIQGHLHNIIAKLNLYQLGIEQELGIVQDWTVTGISGRFPESIRNQHDAFKEIKGTEIIAKDCLTVLRQILTRYKLRIIQQDGIFFIEQIGYLTGTGNKTCHYYNSDGTFDSTTSGTTFNVSVIQKLSGGLDFYREPAKSVEVKYAFQDSINGSNLFNTLIAVNTLTALGEVPSGNGEVLGFGFNFRIQHTGSPPSLLTFYVRFIFEVRCGTQYLTNSGGNYVWNTTAGNRVYIYDTLETEDAYTTNRIEGVGFLTSALPETGDAYIRWNFDLVDQDGNAVTEAGTTTVNNVRNEAFIIYAVGEPNEGTKITLASSGNVSGEKIEVPELVTGDLPYLRSVGRIQKYDGADWINTNEDWGFNAGESLNIDELLSREIMALQKTSVVMKSIILYSDVNVANKIDENIIMTASYIANQNKWSLECFTPVIDRTAITFETFTDSDDPVGGDRTVKSTSSTVGVSPSLAGTVNFWQRASGVLSPVAVADGLQVAEARIGDSTNNLTISTTGHITLNGSATVFDDLRVPVSAIKAAGVKDPGYDIWQGGLRAWFFDKAVIEELFFECQIPHTYKEGSDIYPHVHWIPKASAATATRVRWGLEYTWVNLGETAPANTTIYTASVTPNENLVGYRHYLSAFAAISGTGRTISSMLSCRFFRDATNAADDFDDDAGVLEFDFHIEMDTIGSQTEYSKT